MSNLHSRTRFSGDHPCGSVLSVVQPSPLCLKRVSHPPGDPTAHYAVTGHWFPLLQVSGNACLRSKSVSLFREFLSFSVLKSYYVAHAS